MELVQALGQTRSLGAFYQAVHRETVRRISAPGFFISLYNRDSDEAKVVYYADQGEERVSGYAYPGSRSKAIRFGQPTLVRDRQNARGIFLIGEDDRRTARSGASAPLRHDGRVLGALSVQSYEEGAFDRHDLQVLSNIAHAAAAFLPNLLHVEEVERRRREAEAIEAVGRAVAGSLHLDRVVDEAAGAVGRLLGTGQAALWLLEGDTLKLAASRGDLSVAPAQELTVEGFTGQVLDGRAFQIVDEVEREEGLPAPLRDLFLSGSAVFVPLQTGERVLGMLCTASPRARRFRHDEATLLRRLGDQTALAVQNAQGHRAAHTLSVTDPLTGLPNRRLLQQHLEREVAAAHRGRLLSIVIFDLDNFKGYNDNEGHPAGDRILCRVARILDAESRAMNLVARFGGDEFVSVLSDTDVEGARLHAERVAERVAQDPELARHGLNLSYGAAAFGGEIQSVDALLQAADRAMFLQKDEKRT